MQREEKLIEHAIDAVAMRLVDLRNAISTLIQTMDIEHDTIKWPTFLDNFAIISGHLASLSKVLARDQCPVLRNRTILPLLVSMERDENLSTITQGRIQAFSYDIVPDYLRTRPDPVAEQKMLQNEQKASNITPEAAMKQIAQYNKVVSHIMDMVTKAREEWEIESSSRTGNQQTSSMTDTQLLVATVGTGKGLKMNVPINVPMAGPNNMMVPPTIRAQSPMGPSVSPGNVNPMGKAPAPIKTNIKSAMQVHPFPGR